MAHRLSQPGWYFVKQKFKLYNSQRPGAWLPRAGEQLLIVTGAPTVPGRGGRSSVGTAMMATSQRPLCSLLLLKSGSLLAGRGSGVDWGRHVGDGACRLAEELEVG